MFDSFVSFTSQRSFAPCLIVVAALLLAEAAPLSLIRPSKPWSKVTVPVLQRQAVVRQCSSLSSWVRCC